jgi:Flp pilus assembly protein TadG
MAKTHSGASSSRLLRVRRSLSQVLERSCARVRLFKAANGGAAAIEFALVAIPFFFLLIMLLELALIFLLSITLQSAIVTVSRSIRTGAIQSSNTPTTAAGFVTQVCNAMGWLQTSCVSQLKIDVRPENSFSTLVAPNPMATGTFDPTVLTFNPGIAGQVVLVRAFYQWPLLAPGLDSMFSTSKNGIDVIVESTAFVNEPYS